MMFDSQNSPQQNKKTFVFQNQSTSQSTIAYHKINTQATHVDLKPILDLHCPIQKNKIELFHNDQSKFIPLERINPLNPTFIPISFLEYGFIMFRFKSLKIDEHESLQEQLNEESSQFSSNKKDRSKQRTIGQVIQLVKKWRKLHTGFDGKKLNLQEAAKVVGVSKKSLDDYYYQLRIGQQYDFEFEQNLNQKIGTLRTFVKQNRPEKTQKHRNSKHPKKLRIIEENQSEVNNQSELEIVQDGNYLPPQSPLFINADNQNQSFLSQSGSQFFGKDLQAIQNNYYDCFQNFFDQDNDPYFYTGDFKKKNSYNFGSDSQILF